MNIYIIGCGGVGGFFGGLLLRAGKQVTFVTRPQECRILETRGLTVKSVVGNFTVKKVSVLGTISQIRDADVILVTVKSYDLEGIARELAGVVSKKTIIITFQNGIDNDSVLKKSIKDAAIYPGIAYVVAKRASPGIIEQTSGGRKLIFGDPGNNRNESLKGVAHFLICPGMEATYSADIAGDLWKKYVFIIAYAGMTSISRSPIGAVMKNPVAYPLFEECLREAVMVAKAEKVRLPKNIVKDTIAYTKKHDPSSKSSMLIDIENNRKTEIETLHGTLVRLAEKHRISVPINRLIYSSVSLWGSVDKNDKS